MGCDGYLLKVNEPVRLRLTCYECGLELCDGDITINKHEQCLSNHDGDRALRVLIEVDNLEGR